MDRATALSDAPAWVWLDVCESTNDEAWARVHDPRVLGVGADAQTGGRGRRGRAWSSPPGCGLYVSLIVRPRFGAEQAGTLPLLAGLCVAELARSLGAEARLKWPNDVLVNGRKLAGVLCEARVEAGCIVAVVGVGLNLRTPDGGYGADVPAIALGTERPAREVAEQLATRFFEALSALPTDAPIASIRDRWQALGPPLGAMLRQGGLVGAYAGLDDAGGLLLDTADGRVALHAGEVEPHNASAPMRGE